MTCTVGLAREAEADLQDLLRADRRLFDRILRKLESLSDSPREGKPLVGSHKGEFSLRVGRYRIVYELDAAKHIVFVLTVKHRKHVY